MQSVKLRRADDQDIDTLFSLFDTSLRELFTQYTPRTINYFLEVDYSKEFLKEQLIKKKMIAYLAMAGKRPVGYLLVKKVYGGVGYASWLAVLPSCQKQGIATSFIRMWEQDVLEAGGHALQAWTTKRNLEFYKKCGFTVAGEFPEGWFGRDLFLLYKHLRKPEEQNFLKEYLSNPRR